MTANWGQNAVPVRFATGHRVVPIVIEPHHRAVTPPCGAFGPMGRQQALRRRLAARVIVRHPAFNAIGVPHRSIIAVLGATYMGLLPADMATATVSCAIADRNAHYVIGVASGAVNHDPKRAHYERASARSRRIL